MLAESKALQELISKFVSGVPNFVMAVILAIVGIIISKIVAKIVRKFLEKIGIDKLGDKLNEIDIVDKSNIKIKISTILSKVIYYFMVLFFLVAASDILNMPAVSDLVLGIFNLIPSLIVAGIILILGTLLADAIRGICQTGLQSLGIPSARLIASFVFYFLFINIVISALTQAKINTEFLSQNISLIIGGIVLAFAIGYGLASKTTMANFLASYYSKDKFEVGDTITIDGETGKIVELGKSSLIMISENGNKIIFPLNHISNSKIEIHN
ncbi:MAG: mechanosensitive ion channel [Saprospiraceae bacterium]|nr:mechanosensitive ion channel [Bacteroidia bacterium]MBT8230645.1 mechanosensitive ion channel [Bacteroidia bacterium]NNF22232.1 mechanosensitive ion channel [Saprospiraceae bacterium]